MADYIPILDTQVDPDAPITSSLGYQFRDNPIAISEGAPGAPKVSPLALGGVFKGLINATFSNPADVLGLDRVKTLMLSGSCKSSATGSGGDIRVRYSDDNGASWSALQTLLSFDDQSSTGSFNGVLDLETGEVSVVADQGTGNNIITNTATLTVPSNVNAVRFDVPATPVQLTAIVTAIGGTAT